MITFKTKPSILATGVATGPLEAESPFANLFDMVFSDERIGEKTNEQGQKKLLEEACEIVVAKTSISMKEVDVLLVGDLVNQLTPSNFAASQLQIPFLGMFSACATSVSSLMIAALLTEGGFSQFAIAGASSHHNATERQFRYPIEYGSQSPPSAQWTVTAAGVAAVVPYSVKHPSICCATIGIVVDLKMTDPFNMGAAMAPAAHDTLMRHLKGHHRKVTDYDVIVTGDLGKVGFRLFKELIAKEGIREVEYFRDAGAEFYGGSDQFQAGASGAGCSAAMYFSEVYDQLCKGTYRRVLLIATGALLSPLTVQQQETIPCIAHAIEIIRNE